jgi:hypothetical protein
VLSLVGIVTARRKVTIGPDGRPERANLGSMDIKLDIKIIDNFIIIRKQCIHFVAIQT